MPIGSIDWDKARCVEHPCPLNDYQDKDRKARIIFNCPAGEDHDARVNIKTFKVCPGLLLPREEKILDVDFSDFTDTAAP